MSCLLLGFWKERRKAYRFDHNQLLQNLSCLSSLSCPNAGERCRLCREFGRSLWRDNTGDNITRSST
eukprot:1187480-Prorocentrum_minimum.AAC.2